MQTIEIKRTNGELIYSHTCVANTMAITLIEALNHTKDFRDADFRRADFFRADFIRADFIRADFSGADFTGADFREADFSRADFRFADFREGNFGGAYFIGAYFSGADFTGAYFSVADFRFADFRFADFRGANFRGANFTNILFGGSKLPFKTIGIDNIGYSNDRLVYIYDLHMAYIRCFSGTLDELKDAVIKKHEPDSIYYKQYMGAINYIKSLA